MTAQAQPEADRANIVADGVMNVGEVLEFTRLSKPTIYGLMDSGELPYVRFGKRRLVPKRAVVEFLARGLVAG